MDLKRNVVGWFELPVSDMERAIHFYETVLGMKLERHKMGDFDMAWFPFGDLPGAPGSLVKHDEWYKPSPDGTLIYFSSQSGDLANELGKVENAGGTVLIPKRLISEDIGYMAVFADTEGNKIALHSQE
jgi:predicted enzyme related to lactoylglutathione lyase